MLFDQVTAEAALALLHDGYRLRVGNYRVFFDHDGGKAQVVHIEEVKKRDERTY